MELVKVNGRIAGAIASIFAILLALHLLLASHLPFAGLLVRAYEASAGGPSWKGTMSYFYDLVIPLTAAGVLIARITPREKPYGRGLAMVLVWHLFSVFLFLAMRSLWSELNPGHEPHWPTPRNGARATVLGSHLPMIVMNGIFCVALWFTGATRAER